MARLPIPGSDNNAWGAILNDFLAQAHGSDGLLKDDSVGSTTIQDSSVTTAKIADDSIIPSKLDTDTPASGEVLSYNGSGFEWVSASGGGEANTASNVGTGGVGVYKQKTSVNLEFKKINAGSNKVTVTDDVANSEVDIDVNEANFSSIPQSAVTNLASDLSGKANSSITVSGGTSLTGGGDLTAARTLTLLNDSASPGNSKYYGTDGGGTKGYYSLPSGGETNTASNAGVGGVGVYYQKSGVDLQFKSINSGSNKITITDDTTNHEIDINVNEANLSGIPQSAVTNLASDLSGKISTTEKAAANGVATLDSGGKIPSGQLPSISSAKVLPFSNTGTLTATAGTHRLYNDSGSAWTILSVRASVGTAPTGASVIIDVNKNGTTIFTTQANRPTIAASGNTSGKVTNMDITSVANGDYITVDVDQVGSTIAGADLTLQLEVQ